MKAHRINCVEIELVLDRTDLARQLLDRISGLRERRIAPLIERVCSELSEPDQYDRLDSIEIDLGSVALHDFDDDFSRKLDDALRTELKKQLVRQRLGGRSGNASLQLLECFARTGNVPWWVDSLEPGLVGKHICKLLEKAPVEWFELLRALNDDQPALSRLARHCDDLTLKNILEHENHDLGVLDELREIERMLDRADGAPRLGSSSTHRVRTSLLAVLSLHPGSGTPELVRALLVELATAFGAGFWILIQQSVRRQTTQRLRRLLEEGASNPEQVPDLAGISGPKDVARTAGELSAERSAVKAWDASVRRLEPAERRPTVETDLPPPEILHPIESFDPVECSEQHCSDANFVEADPEQSLDALMTHRELAEAQLPKSVELEPIADDPTTRLIESTEAASPTRVPASLEEAHRNDDTQNTSAKMGYDPAVHRRLFDLSSAVPLMPAKEPSKHDTSFGLKAAIHVPARQSAPSPVRDAARRRALAQLEQLYVDDAGLVLLWPFLDRFFQRTGLLDENGRFFDQPAMMQGVALLSYLAWQDPDPPEYRMPLAKLLCGMAPETPYALERPLANAQVAECEHLLAAVIEHARILGELSPLEFSGAFLRRAGVLSTRDGIWLLQIESATQDAVLERFSWSWHWVRLAWMSDPLQVEW